MKRLELEIVTFDDLEAFIFKVTKAAVNECLKESKLQQSQGKLHSIKELAELSGVSELTIRNWIEAGKIEAKRIGRRIFIEQSQFENALNDVKSLRYKR